MKIDKNDIRLPDVIFALLVILWILLFINPINWLHIAIWALSGVALLYDFI